MYISGQIISILFIVLGIYNFGHRLRLVTKTGGSLYGIFRRHRRQTKAGNYYILYRVCERKSWKEFKIFFYTFRYSPKILMICTIQAVESIPFSNHLSNQKCGGNIFSQLILSQILIHTKVFKIVTDTYSICQFKYFLTIF